MSGKTDVRFPRPVNFAMLRHRITAAYAALFMAIASVLIVVGSFGVEHYAEQTIAKDMGANAAVFDEILAARSRQMRSSAEILSRDFGFRESVALGDAATVASALESLQDRASVSYAFVVGIDGSIIGNVAGIKKSELASISNALDSGKEAGIIETDGKLASAVAAPIEIPNLAGWLILAQPLDQATMQRLTQLAAIDLEAEVKMASQLPDALSDAARAQGETTEVDVAGERMLYSISKLQPLGDQLRPRLVLSHSLTMALSEYREIFWLLLGLTIVALGAVIALGGFVAKGVTLPIAKLDEAARKFSSGERTFVEVETKDEVGRLAESFNFMVDAIEERERKISHIALHDILTGLPNRKLFAEQMDFALARLDSTGGLVLGYLDLDNFKLVNDTLGHPVGDGLLKQIAERLKQQLPNNVIARLSGDEFAIMASGAEAGTGYVNFAQKLHQIFDEPFMVDSHTVPIQPSIGFAIAPNDGRTVTELLKNADLALYRAKQEGKGCYQFFEPAMDEQARQRRQVEIDLRNAIKTGQFELYYQPLYSLEKERLTGFEALLRWIHPDRGLVNPLEFIGIAEETNLIIPIGEWVIREACRQAALWPEELRIAVNISPLQFRSANLSNVIIQSLAASRISPSRLELEITESIFIENVENTLKCLHNLRNVGVRIALDDFGTGYSSLSYLRSFPFDKIKIDRSFVMDLQSGAPASAIIRAITTLADALGMETLAEGVEYEEQADLLRNEGCQQVQGYFYSRPVPAKDASALIAQFGGGFKRDIRKVA
ncbi:MAG: EAL domain-containing protein [Pseudomonadota bacterium]